LNEEELSKKLKNTFPLLNKCQILPGLGYFESLGLQVQKQAPRIDRQNQELDPFYLAGAMRLAEIIDRPETSQRICPEPAILVVSFGITVHNVIYNIALNPDKKNRHQQLKILPLLGSLSVPKPQDS
ncbi:MAG: hypothetical protein HQK55_04190, partial [Deltaproteobacteria bacterium]|nr:hypothetical protein [Deltaproteobacteria bacterium]